MGSDDGGRDYSLTEIFAIKFVLADIIIIAALLFAGPLYALAITALLVLSVVLVWYLMERSKEKERKREQEAAERDTATATAADEAETDPVTTLQRRYAAGDLTEAEFERQLDQLIDANERADEADVDTSELSLERS
ncbi:hypothetical protein C483_18803 [Natrialba hulunbeirensis JCM 10989]|uniref:SHOCT domain-containing protein n=1 Tax=Natrialba hulunbeirensis JCM 10989 TaxID=1227493 RepID=L9ZQD3_9EURY|nr:SHOCT domain-containing protein [Natrialba hulunbeirensis]ELY87368.1 hypothetical protein C483_18803 [Natrialba hulunbeirensis JCM 10989]